MGCLFLLCLYDRWHLYYGIEDTIRNTWSPIGFYEFVLLLWSGIMFTVVSSILVQFMDVSVRLVVCHLFLFHFLGYLVHNTSFKPPLFVIDVPIPRKWADMYRCVRGIDFDSFFYFSIGSRNCSNRGIFLFFIWFLRLHYLHEITIIFLIPHIG